VKNKTVCWQPATRISPPPLQSRAVWRENAMRFIDVILGAPKWVIFVWILSALLLLSSCASSPAVEHVAVETRIVEVPVEVVKPLPAQYTRPLSYPPPIGEAVTVESLIDRIFLLYDIVDQANEDRAGAKDLTDP
jgi:hypothetical protein